MVPKVLDAVDHDFENSVFSYIPNTAQASYYGMVAGLNEELTKQQTKKILELGTNISADKLAEVFLLPVAPR